MPVLTQLNLNIGTEQNPNMVLHDLHDIRISSTDVNTVTRLLGCDAGVNSIAPLTLDKAASLLGEYTEASRGSVAGQSVTIPYKSDRAMIVFFNSARGSKSVNFLNTNMETIKADSSIFWCFTNDGTNITCTCTDTNSSRTNTLYYKYV